MSTLFTPIALIEKSRRACASAQVLLDAGDTDGACNRAYYAMFDAARAALLASNAPVKSDIGKTHRGLMNAFSEHLVKSGRIPKTLGKLLKQAQTFRCVADYEGGSVELSDAQEMVRQADTFISTICAEFMPENRNSHRHEIKP